MSLIQSSIAKRFILYILIFSTVITTVLTAVQLKIDYDNGIRQIHNDIEVVRASHLDGLINSLWQFDQQALQIQLDGMFKLKDMQYLQLRSADGLNLQAGESVESEHLISETFVLSKVYDGVRVELGTLQVHFTLTRLYQRLIDKALIIAFTQAIKTFLVSFFIFIIFYHLIGKHLTALVQWAKGYRLNSAHSGFQLQRTHNPPDELKSLAQAFNQMRQNIHDDTFQLRLFRRLIESSRDALYVLDAHTGHILDVNRAACEMLGYEPEHLLQMNIRSLSVGLQTSMDFESIAAATREQQRGLTFEDLHKHKNGSHIPVEISSVFFEQAEDKAVFVCGVRDISERQRALKAIEYQAQHDQLTDLPNRYLLYDRINQQILEANRLQQHLLLMFIDLDHFKHINDSYGHSFGDRVLIEAGKRLQQALRKSDILGRLGGDEFVALAPINKGEESFTQLAKKILEAFQQPFEFENTQILIHSSIGLCVYPDDGESAEILLRNADAAMYKAKNAGRNSFQFYSPELTELAEQRIQLQQEIDQALKNREFVAYFQPQLDSNSGRTCGAEALVRWLHPKRGLVPPAEFIPIAEKTGQIREIDQFMLESVCQFIQKWQAEDLQIPRISVNFSGNEIEAREFCQGIAAILESHRSVATKIEIEITESQFMHHPQHCMEEMQKLRNKGITLAVDDFGTGYSSLSYLKNLPIDKLKIDQSFVSGLPQDSADCSIVRSIIALAHNLNLQLIAEGVENSQQQGFLREAGCPKQQGFLYSQPLDEKAFVNYLKTHKGKLRSA